MSDQTTLSSFEDSTSQMNPNATTTTTPPVGEFTKQKSSSNASKSSAAADTSDFDSLPGVLSSLNLDEKNMFSHKFNGVGRPSTPPNEWKVLNAWSATNPAAGSGSFGNFASINELQTGAKTSANNIASNHQYSLSASTEESSEIKPQGSPFNSMNAAMASTSNTVNVGNSANNSFILSDNQLDPYLFESSITNTSAALTPSTNKTAHFTNTPVLAETSRRLNYNLSPNQQTKQDVDIKEQPNNSNDPSALQSVLNNDILTGNVGSESLGMGITSPMMNSNDPSNIFGNYMPNHFGFLPTAVTPPLNALGNPLMNPNHPALSMIPGLNVTPQLHSSFMSSPPSNYQPIISQNYPYDNNLNKTMMVGNGKDINIDDNSSMDNNIRNGAADGNVAGTGAINHRNNLGLNSTANVHRKHSSNNRRGEDASKFVNASLNDFVNEIYYLCKDQHGCRFLQRQLELNGSNAATKIFNEIQLNVIELMIDPFGNYLIQKLLERVDDTQRTTLVRNASSQFVRIALDPHGTRALQKLVECISTKNEFEIIINSLSSYVVLLSRDLNGNHVIQKCLQKLPPDYCEFIFDAACEYCVKIAKHRHGCCVLQRCFDHGTPMQCERLALKVGENSVELSIDPYGNYVVQYVLSMEENRLRIQNDPSSVNKIPDTSKSIDFIIASLATNLTKLSTHKFGSNVIEKSLRIPTLAPVLIQHLLKSPESLKLLLHDAYGNYVLQTSLDVADDSSFKDLSELLKPFLNDVRNTPHGRRILSKLISRGGNASILSGPNGNLLNGTPIENLNTDSNNSNNNSRRHNHNNNHNNHNHGHSHHNNSNNNMYNTNYVPERVAYNMVNEGHKNMNQMNRYGY